MSEPIENYALLSDCYSAALVSKTGSIDWLSLPCFDSPAFFASLLGDTENGRWLIAPKHGHEVKRKYLEDTMILETTFMTNSGSFTLTDCMLTEEESPTLIRTIKGISGTVDVVMELIIRFDYGSIIPWVRMNQETNGIHAVAGPDALVLYSPYKLHGKNLHTCTEFTLKEGEEKSFQLSWYPSHKSIPKKMDDTSKSVEKTRAFWSNWMKTSTYHGFDEESVKRSLLTIKALTYKPTGAIVAAATTSLPEALGGERNWDYRYSWIRDSSFALFALLRSGYKDEAIQWKEWLMRALAGTPSQVNIMYGIRGERRLTEIELEWLPGYADSRPVRIGNDAYKQFQLDVFGEFISTSSLGRKNGIHLEDSDRSWRIERKMIDYICEHWNEKDDGIWEVRGPKQHFTHSKMMAWLALKHAVNAIKIYGLEGELQKWESLRDKIHAEICEKGYNKKLNSFVQYYGSDELDASLLMMGHMEFLPTHDPRMVGTVDAIKKHLLQDGLLRRYAPNNSVDNLPGTEGTFIACSFWLVDNLRMQGRKDEAMELYQHLQSLRNDVGLFAEEYDVKHKRMVGNYPQAFSHISQAVSAMGIQNHESPIKENLH